MKTGFNTLQQHRSANCEVCGCAINFPDSLTLKDPESQVCRSFDCRRVIEQKRRMAPAMFKSFLKFNREMIQRHRDKNAARNKRIEEIKQRQQQQSEAIYQSVLNRDTQYSEENLDLLVIPSGSVALAAINQQRVEAYTQHLTQIINEAAEYAKAEDVIYDEHHDAYAKRLLVDQRLDNNPALRELSDQLCTLCKGGCCASGKDHAYLSVFSMRRFMDENPHLTPDDVLQLYLSHLASASMSNSCINHTQTGCALPRELRSDICNGYYCDSLKSYQQQNAEVADRAALLVVQRSSSYWDRFEPGVDNEVVNVVLLGDGQRVEIAWRASNKAGQ